MPSRHDFSASHLASRPLRWVLLVVYGLVASGLPVPLVAPAPATGTPAARQLAAKDRSQPFPCMDKPCGCATAEQCFTKCCCHTPAETLAWARSHRLAPQILTALERRAGSVPRVAVAGSCCAAQASRPAARPSCCQTGEGSADTAAAEVCSDYQSLAADVVPAPVESRGEDRPTSRPRVVVLRAMLACGGVLSGWLATGVALPPPPIMTCERLLHPCGIVVSPDLPATGVRSAPDAPPPRA
jgi:hypothetical protein